MSAFLEKIKALKYDPCRLFKKGDKVRVVAWNGRESMRDGEVGFVVKKEEASGMVELSIDGWKNGVFYHACNLELVTPVEELEPYSIEKNIHGWIVYKDNPGNIVANFNNTHPHAKEAAEAECARLNAEHRKEQA